MNGARLEVVIYWHVDDSFDRTGRMADGDCRLVGIGLTSCVWDWLSPRAMGDMSD